VVRTVAGTLGLVALLVAIVVGMLAAFGAFGPKVTTSSPVVPLEAIPERTVQDEPTADAAAIGETVTTGDVSWTVTDARKESELRKYTFPPEEAPGDFVTLTFTAENVSEEPVTLEAEEITLFDREGNEYRPAADRNDAFIEHEKNLLFSEAGLLEPGQTKEGEVNFEVLPRASGFTVQLGDTDPNTSEEEYVDLGL
jgi:hypothetical protein